MTIMAAENYRKFVRHLLLIAVFVACLNITYCSSTTPQSLDKTDLTQKAKQPTIQQINNNQKNENFIDSTEDSTPQEEEEEETATEAGEDLTGSEFFLLKKLLFKKFAFGGFHGGFRKRGFGGHGGGYCCGGGYGHHGGFGGGYGHGGGYGGGFGHGGGFYGGGYKKGYWG